MSGHTSVFFRLTPIHDKVGVIKIFQHTVERIIILALKTKHPYSMLMGALPPSDTTGTL